MITKIPIILENQHGFALDFSEANPGDQFFVVTDPDEKGVRKKILMTVTMRGKRMLVYIEPNGKVHNIHNWHKESVRGYLWGDEQLQKFSRDLF